MDRSQSVLHYILSIARRDSHTLCALSKWSPIPFKILYCQEGADVGINGAFSLNFHRRSVFMFILDRPLINPLELLLLIMLYLTKFIYTKFKLVRQPLKGKKDSVQDV